MNITNDEWAVDSFPVEIYNNIQESHIQVASFAQFFFQKTEVPSQEITVGQPPRTYIVASQFLKDAARHGLPLQVGEEERTYGCDDSQITELCQALTSIADGTPHSLLDITAVTQQGIFADLLEKVGTAYQNTFDRTPVLDHRNFTRQMSVTREQGKIQIKASITGTLTEELPLFSDDGEILPVDTKLPTAIPITSQATYDLRDKTIDFQWSLPLPTDTPHTPPSWFNWFRK